MDHGASTHPPRPVLDTFKDFLEHSYANVHRGQHYLSQMATDRFEHVSDDILRFIGAEPDRRGLILLGNTTQALDLAAHVMAGHEGITLVSLMEHHSNDLPHRARGEVVHFGVREDGTLDYDDLEAKLQAQRVKLVAVTGASNVTGYIVDVHRVARLAHAHGARVLIDAAQRLAHESLCVLPPRRPGPPRLRRGGRAQGLRAVRLGLPLRAGGPLRRGAALHPGRRHGRLRHRGRRLLQEVAGPPRGRHAEHRRRRRAGGGAALPRGDRHRQGARARARAGRAGHGRRSRGSTACTCSATRTRSCASVRSR